MIEALDRCAAADVSLRNVLQRRPQSLRRLVALGLVVELHRVAVGIGELVGRAVAEISVDPPDPAPAALDRGDAALERRLTPGAHRDVTEAG